MIYLASPHAHPEATIRHDRFYAAMRATAIILKRGEFVYSPIVHCHEMAILHNMETMDFKYWQAFDEHMIGLSDEIQVLCIDGWRESRGVQSEIKFAEANLIPVSYIDHEARHIDPIFS